jgi:hypothetical protein
MSRVKLSFVMLVLAAFACLATQVQAATTFEVSIAGSSALWQTLALGAYSDAGSGAGHWTSASNAIDLTDTRTTPENVDPGTLWVVWNSAGTEVWTFIKVDSVVGNRCYFAQPACTLSGTSTTLGTTGANQITVWPDGSSDQALPANVLAALEAGTAVTIAATDIRPEDANFAICRVNSSIGAGTFPVAAQSDDGLDGLGYNTNWAPGACATSGKSSSAYVGTPIQSALPGSTSVANVVSFNIKGTDPISGTKIPAFTVDEVGATPVVIIFARENNLAGLSNVSTQQLQQAFSGTNCDASAFGLTEGAIGIFLREPLSGTYNTAEATIFRHPNVYPGDPLGVSQETNVYNTTTNEPNDPLNAQSGTCLNGAGGRYRGVGTSDEVNWVAKSNTDLSHDGIGYTFFSYGNVKAIGGSTSFAYATLNNIDPIFQSYGPQSSTGTGYDPGQPGTSADPGELPVASDTPCGSFPCSEGKIWTGGLSFPNVRNGSYQAWSLLRLVGTTGSASLKAAETLVKDSQAYVVTTTPDYVPATKTVAGGITDPGLELVRSHYQQYDGAGTALGAAPVNCGTTEAGGDVGGWILQFVSGKCPTTPTQQVQGNQGVQVRPANP